MPQRFIFKRPALGVLLAMLIAGSVTAVWSSRHAHAQTVDVAEPSAVAGVARVQRQDLFKEVKFLAEFRPYQEVELHAKVSGYVKQLNVDFGDKVKAGQLLATLEVPELQDQLKSAMAAEQKTEVDYTNAHLMLTRLQSVNREHPNLVAQQDLDTAAATDLAAAAAIAATKADVGRYETMAEYTRITAPFDGVVTRRYADPGALIQAGTSSDLQAKSLLRVSDNYKLRLDFPVTVDYVPNIHVGDEVEGMIDSMGGKTFSGKIARFTYDLDDATRKMTTEIEVANPDLAFLPGMYVTVSVKVEKHSHALAVPIEAVAVGKTAIAMVVNAQDQIEEHPVKLGLETPDYYEVLAGLKEGDRVVIGNRSAYRAGEKVEPREVQISMRGS